MTNTSNDDHNKKRLSILQLLGSAIGAFFGVQKSEIRDRDFKRGRPIDFIITGILLTTVFVLGLVGLVKLVMYFAGI